MAGLLEQISQDSPGALTTLRRILGNVVTSPDNTKYRTLKKTSKLVANDILPSQAAMSLLSAVGFNDCGDTLECPMDADLQVMSEVVDLIAALPPSGQDCGYGATTIVAGQIVRKGDAGMFQRRAEKGSSQNGFRVALDAAQQRVRAGEGEAQFQRRERPSAEVDELQKARELWKNQNLAAPAADATNSSTAALEPQQSASTTQSGAKKKSVFDFQDRREAERKRREAAQAMEDLRQARKEKYSKQCLGSPLTLEEFISS